MLIDGVEIMYFGYTDKEIIYYAIVFFFIVIQKYFLDERLKNKDKMKKRGQLVGFLRSDEKIDECIKCFEKLESTQGNYSFIFIIMCMAAGTYLSIEIHNHYLNNLNDVWLAGAKQSIVNFIPLAALVLIGTYIDHLKENRIDFIPKANRIITFFTGMFWFIFVSNLYILMTFFENFSNSNFRLPFNLGEILSTYILLYFILTIAILGLRNSKKYYLNDLKSILNERHLDEFPSIHITTKDEMISGKIQDVFNENSITLDNGEMRITVDWDEVSILKLQKKKDIKSKYDDVWTYL